MATKITIENDTVEITYPGGESRVYRTIGHESGYVYDVTYRPGTLGRQVFDPRAPTGTMLTGPRDGRALAYLLRRCLRSARGRAARYGYGEPADVKL